MTFSFVFPVLAFAVLTLITGVAWWLMVRKPSQWARWAERENGYWLKKGLISTSLAERMKRWETGRALRLLLAITTLAGAMGFAVTASFFAKAMSLANRKPVPMYTPTFLNKPIQRPATNRPAATRPQTNKPPKVTSRSAATNKTARP